MVQIDIKVKCGYCGDWFTPVENTRVYTDYGDAVKISSLRKTRVDALYDNDTLLCTPGCLSRFVERELNNAGTKD